MIYYQLKVPTPASHVIHVELTVATPNPAGQQLFMPAWIPGSYMIRDYARHIVSIDAQCNGKSVDLTEIDKSTWQVSPCDGPLLVRYEVYAWDSSVRGAHLDNTHWYFNGPCVFISAIGHTDTPHEVTLEQPGSHATQWQVATSMRVVDIDSAGFGRYRADDYAELIDQPFEIAEQDHLNFEAGGVRHDFYIRGAHKFDAARLAEDTRRICNEHHALLGTPADLDRYVFLADASDVGYGGLEHAHSTSLAITRSALPVAGRAEMDDAYRKLLGLISHEYFHLWNVKRLKPEVFSPYDLTSESYTRLLWVYEGITSYYDDLALVRAGVIDVNAYLELLGEQITRVWRVPGRHTQTLAQSSFYAWTKLYKRNANSSNATISYYTKGSLIALALDLTLRANAESHTLDDVMRFAWQRFVIEGQGMPETGLEDIVVAHCDGDYRPFFERYVRGTEDPDFAALFAAVGVTFQLRCAIGDSDAGGKPASAATGEVWLGLSTTKRLGGVTVTSVKHDGPAEKAGLAPGDVMIAVDGLKLSRSSWPKIFGRLQPGDSVALDYFREDRLFRTKLVVSVRPADRCYLELQDDDPAAVASREAWLRSRQ